MNDQRTREEAEKIKRRAEKLQKDLMDKWSDEGERKSSIDSL
jgi:hypothetical protein